ncbi:MAG: hypothetical protein MI919_10125 [Holophagales bacterium]|nr:hypothetical protein [Holophagales bacterium]
MPASRFPFFAPTLGCLLATLPLLEPSPAQGRIFEDGFESGTTAAWAQAVGEPPVTSFRLDDLDLRDPHVFVNVPGFGCRDFTDDDLPLGLAPSFNSSVETAITTDGDGDGFLDQSQMLLFRPLDEMAAGARMDLRNGQCTSPLATTSCLPEPGSVITLHTYQGLDAGICFEEVPGTTSGYSPGVGTTPAPCFGTLAIDAQVAIAGVQVVLRDLERAAGFVGIPTSSLTDGWIRGFLREADADAVLLPADVPLVGGQPLSILLPGGTGSCAAGDDRDIHGGFSGWWFYLEHTAVEVPYSDG